jgi:sec-independent protein translocase protein TatA
MTTGLLAELLGPDGLIVIAVLALVLLFGGSQLPKLARGLGSASHEFRKGLTQGDPDAANPEHTDAATPSSASLHSVEHKSS